MKARAVPATVDSAISRSLKTKRRGSLALFRAGKARVDSVGAREFEPESQETLSAKETYSDRSRSGKEQVAT